MITILEHERFTRKEEAVLARAKDAGDMVARKRLILSCLPLAVSIATRMVQGIEAGTMREQRREEAVSDAMVGLIEAVDSLDPDRGRLTTLVTVCVRQVIRHCWSVYNGSIYVPPHATSPNRVQSETTAKRVAAVLAVTPLTPQTLDSLEGLERNPADIAETADEYRRVTAVLGTLNERQQQVVNLVVRDGQLLSTVGEVMGVERQRVHQIKTEALRQMREKLAD